MEDNPSQRNCYNQWSLPSFSTKGNRVFQIVLRGGGKSPLVGGSQKFCKGEYFYWGVRTLKKALCPLFMDGVQLPQGYRATSRREFTFYHQVPRKLWYSSDRPWKDERLSQPWSHPVVLNMGPVD